MATLPGTNVAAKIVPFDSNDTFATHDEKYGLGGFRSVANQAERDSITSLRLKTGMLVYQLDENKYYRLTSTVQPISANWIETFVGTGSGGGDITRAEVAYISGNLQQQINNISSPSLSAYTLLVMTSDISGYLNNKINTISNSITGYTLLTTTSLISSGLSNRIDQNYSYISSISGKNNTQQLQIDGLVNLSGGVALKTDLVSVSGNLYSLTKEISGTSEGAYHIASNLMSTGIVSGGILTAATSSSFNISSGLGMIIDHTVLNGKNNPRANVYTWSAINNVSVTPFITAGVPYIFVGLDSNLNLHYATNEFTPQERRDYMELGKVSLRGGRVVAVVSKKGIPFDYGASIWDIGEALGALNLSGNVFSPSGNNLSITKSAGTSFRYSVNVDTNRKQPSLTTDPSLNPVTFFRAYRNAAFTDFTYVPNQTIVDPNYYDNGSGTLHTVGNNDWSVQRVYYFPSGGNTYVLYGQSTYSSLSLARSSISTENFQIPDDILNGSVFRGWLVVKEGATNLSSNSQSVFIPAGKFGTVGGGGASGAVSNHNDLANIQGGSLNQYYHLTASELNSISGFATNSLITSITGQFATITLVNGMSGVLQSNINSKVSADILRAEVSSISSSLQNNIDNFKTQVVGTTGNLQAQINTKIGDAPSDGNQYARKNAAWVIVTGVTGTGSSGAGFVPLAGTGMTITPSGNNYLFNVNDYISKTETRSISSNLQDQILFKKYTGYTALTSISGQSYPVLVGAVSGQPSSIDKLDASSSASYVSPLGFVTQNVSAGQQTSILWNGEISFPSSTFIPGLVAYANPYVFGAITQTKPVSSGQYIISVGTAKTDSILSVNIEDPYLISAIDSPAQDRAVYFRSPTQLGSITVEVGDILVLNDTSESHPNLLTTGNYIVYRCILQYIGDGNAINGSELLTNFLAIGNQPKYNQPVNFLDITPSGLGQNGLKVSKGELLIIDDSTVYSSVIPGSGNKNYYPTFVCTNPITGAGSTVSRSQIESNFRQLHDNKFKLSTTTNNNSSSVNLDFSSTTYEAYHITVKVMADGSTGYKFFATYQFGMTGEPIGAGGCTIQGALTEDILFNPLTELAVVFSDPGDALQITFNSTGRVGETYTWKAWVIVERF